MNFFVYSPTFPIYLSLFFPPDNIDRHHSRNISYIISSHIPYSQDHLYKWNDDDRDTFSLDVDESLEKVLIELY